MIYENLIVNRENLLSLKNLKILVRINMKIIVSLTTYPKRIEYLKTCLPYILNQTLKYDILRINLDDSLTNEEIKLYDEIKKLDSRIEIGFGKSLFRSANKLLPTIKEYPNDLVITCDDDQRYTAEMFKELYDKWLENPNCIIAHEINPVLINENNEVYFMNSFDIKLLQKEFGKYLSNCCLFPPRTFENTDVFNEKDFMYVTNAKHDELWFWLHSTMKGVYCIGLNSTMSLELDEITLPLDETALTNENKENDVIAGYIKRYNELYKDKLLDIFKKNPIIINLTKDNYQAIIGNLNILYNFYFKNALIFKIDSTIKKSHIKLLYRYIHKIKNWKIV